MFLLCLDRISLYTNLYMHTRGSRNLGISHVENSTNVMIGYFPFVLFFIYYIRICYIVRLQEVYGTIKNQKENNK